MDIKIDCAPQGWQCPICKRVYSPTTPMCWYCGNEKAVTSTSTKVLSSSDEKMGENYDGRCMDSNH